MYNICIYLTIFEYILSCSVPSTDDRAEMDRQMDRLTEHDRTVDIEFQPFMDHVQETKDVAQLYTMASY